MSLSPTLVSSISGLLEAVKRDTQGWHSGSFGSAVKWYRGQPCTDAPIPKLFRDRRYDEFELTKMFRERAGAFGNAPETNRLDKWLFLMQHYGAPTRLLDWTESLLIALFFAVDSVCPGSEKDARKYQPTIWVLNPPALNGLSGVTGFPNTFVRRDKRQPDPEDTYREYNQNPGLEHFRLAFHPSEEFPLEINHKIVERPLAVQTTYFDLRMYSQRSCFTVHGTAKSDFEALTKATCALEPNAWLLKYRIAPEAIDDIRCDLRTMGIDRATVFPDLAGLAKELAARFVRREGD